MSDIHNLKWQQYHHFLESVIISFCLTLFMNAYFNLAIPSPLILIEVILFSGMLAVFDLSAKKNLSFILGAGAFMLILLLTSCLNINLFKYVLKTVAWFKSFYMLDGTYIFHYAFTIVLIISLLTSLCLYPLQKFKYTKLLLMLGLFSGLICCCIQNIILSKGIIFLALTYNACVLTQLIYQFQNNAHFLRYKNASTFLLPFSLLIVLPVLILPSAKKPINWKFATDFTRNIVESTDNFFYDLQVRYGHENSEFGMNLNGFNTSDTTTLGGRITDSDDVLLSLSTKSAFKNPIYLKGSIYNIYTGEAWKKENLPALPQYNEFELDCYENLYSLYRSNLTASEEVFHPVCIDLNYEALRTRSLFWPNSTHQLLQKDVQKKLNTQGPNILFSRTQNRGLHYQLYFTEANVNYLPFTNYLRSLDHFHYASSPEIAAPLNTSTLSENALFFQVYNPDTAFFTDHTTFNTAVFNTGLESILSQRAALIHDAYTTLPKTLPPKVYNLANKITKDAPTAYDKLKAIEAYLKQFKYTKTPGSLPKNQDFVDDFLFNTQEGYCTYFASAMVVLARCINIPTRYVEGFIVTPNGSFAYNTSCNLTSQELHAWPEAYIEGYGWLTFEPTPGYSATCDDAWVTKKPAASAAPSPSYPPESSISEVNGDLPALTIEEKKPLHITLTILLLLGLLILLFILYITYMALRYTREMQKGNANQKAKLLFIEILFCLQKRGYKKAPSQSLLEYTQYVSTNSFISNDTTFGQIVNTYLSYRYGHHLVTDAELLLLHNYCKLLYDQTTGHFKALKILVLKISFLINGYKV